MPISPHNTLRQPSPLLRRYFYYIIVYVTCKLMCYKRARPYAHCDSTMHTYPLRRCPTFTDTMPCRTVSANEIMRQLRIPLQSALTNPCSCLLHTFPDYRRSALAITSSENACVALQNQTMQVNTIHTCIKVSSELKFCVCLAT